jgi:pyruvate,water dikinase
MEPKETSYQWHTVVDMILSSDQRLYSRMARKLMNYMCNQSIQNACYFFTDDEFNEFSHNPDYENAPTSLQKAMNSQSIAQQAFQLAQENLPEEVVLKLLRRWLQEDKASFIFRTLVNHDHHLADVAESVRKFIELNPPNGLEVSEAMGKAIQVLLIRRVITTQVDYISHAKRALTIRDFYEMFDTTIIPGKSHGVIGGKAAGLFLAWKIVRNHLEEKPSLAKINIPKTWYLPSDSLHYFMNYNDMEDMFEQKYKSIEEIRNEYPHLIQLFKSSRFPPDIIQGLSMALDDLGDCPVIVRSSSRLEDQFGAVFSGKYKSLFLANQGTKVERLKGLMDAVAEVYSSLFGPDPLLYRAEKNLLDVREEMGVIIQQVVGTTIGDYYFPLCAGIAFSTNEFRWSPRIERNDGFLRIVPGLGTRAVDRVGDDYPILLAPGKPDLRVSQDTKEIQRYSPRKADVVNLAKKSFETVLVSDLYRQYGDQIPELEQAVSVIEGDNLVLKSRITLNPQEDSYVTTFEGLCARTEFLTTMGDLLSVLSHELDTPVDIEFAYSQGSVWLLQCRPQSLRGDQKPGEIPANLDPDKILFSGSKYISDGQVKGIEYLVYVDPEAYLALSNKESMATVAEIIGLLNGMLPKQTFILVGPGRWGSKGDICLGVGVTYADISNCAILVESAFETGDLSPDLSFGTHFFQDLVEAGIKYLPLFPQEPGGYFNSKLIMQATNSLPELLPLYRHYKEVVKVIHPKDLQQNTKEIQVMMNGEQNKAVCYLC